MAKSIIRQVVKRVTEKSLLGNKKKWRLFRHWKWHGLLFKKMKMDLFLEKGELRIKTSRLNTELQEKLNLFLWVFMKIAVP